MLSIRRARLLGTGFASKRANLESGNIMREGPRDYRHKDDRGLPAEHRKGLLMASVIWAVMFGVFMFVFEVMKH